MNTFYFILYLLFIIITSLNYKITRADRELISNSIDSNGPSKAGQSQRQQGRTPIKFPQITLPCWILGNCNKPGPPPPSPPPSPPPATPPPPTPPPSPPPSTVAPTTPPPPPPPTAPRPPPDGAPDGSWCNASICEIEVGCRSYRLCQRTDLTGNPDNMNGTIVTIFCKKNHFVVPVNVSNAEAGKVAVAACQKWEELSTDRQQEILTDEECSYCDLIPEGLCTSQFRYRNSTGALGEIENCPLNLIMDTMQKSCVQPCDAKGAIRAACVSNGKCTS